MPYVQIPKDLTQVKTKVALNLTKRQIVCFAGAAATAFPFYLLTNGLFGTTGAALGILVVAFPWFAFALYERDGQPLEKYLMNVIQARFFASPRSEIPDAEFLRLPARAGKYQQGGYSECRSRDRRNRQKK